MEEVRLLGLAGAIVREWNHDAEAQARLAWGLEPDESPDGSVNPTDSRRTLRDGAWRLMQGVDRQLNALVGHYRGGRAAA